MRVTLEEILEVTGGQTADAQAPAAVRPASFHTDSREVVEGGAFFALRGAAMDGHAFVRDAEAHGAVLAIVERPVQGIGIAQVVVPDTWKALYDLAGWVLRRVSPLVVGVTGSNGKTSTKEMTAAVLSATLRVHRNEGNLNTETGLPLTILKLEPQTDALVVEMGVQKPGDMARLVALARPRAAIVTNIGSVHVEFFGTLDAIAREKGQLVAALPEDGLAVLNADDRYLPVLRQLAKGWVRTVGIERGDVRATGYRTLPDGDAVFEVAGIEVRLGMAGRHQVRNALAALVVSDFAGVPINAAAQRLEAVRVEHRMQRITTPDGFDLIDDAYNASPESMLAAFDSIADMPVTGPKLAVLGEMRELGGMADEEHRRIGKLAAEVFDAVCVANVGRGQMLAQAAGGELVDSKEAAVAWVRGHAAPGAVVLIKASHGVALGDVVRRLTEQQTESQPQTA